MNRKVWLKGNTLPLGINLNLPSFTWWFCCTFLTGCSCHQNIVGIFAPVYHICAVYLKCAQGCIKVASSDRVEGAVVYTTRGRHMSDGRSTGSGRAALLLPPPTFAIRHCCQETVGFFIVLIEAVSASRWLVLLHWWPSTPPPPVVGMSVSPQFDSSCQGTVVIKGHSHPGH